VTFHQSYTLTLFMYNFEQYQFLSWHNLMNFFDPLQMLTAC